MSVRHRARITALALVLIGVASATVAAAVHFRLERSEPAAEAAVTDVSEVRLWFSQEPQAGSTSIRVVDGAGELIPAADVVALADDRTVQVLALEQRLAPGSYRVFWRAMAADSHVVRDEFAFSVGESAGP